MTERSGRSLEEFRRYVTVFLAVDDDRDAARERARQSVENLYTVKPHAHYDRLLRAQGFAAVADVLTEAARRDDATAARAAIPDELLDRLTIYGDETTCLRRLNEYAAVVDRVLLSNVDAVRYQTSADDPASSGLVASSAPVLSLVERFARSEHEIPPILILYVERDMRRSRCVTL